DLVPRRQIVDADAVGMATTYGTLPLGGIIFTLLAGLATAIGKKVPYFAHNNQFLALWIDGLSFLFSAYMVSRRPIRAMRPSTRERFHLANAGKDIRDGITFLRGHRLARAMTRGIV